MELQTRFDDAVSPVVGVILMVAVTVILAAVIGTFVLDLGNNVQANPQAGVNFDQTPDDSGVAAANVTAQVISMENADYLSASSDGASVTFNASDSTDHDGDGSAANDVDSVGETITAEHLANGDSVTIIGSLDGKQAVLQTYTVDA